MTTPQPTMRAAVLATPGRIEIREVQRPLPQGNQVLVRVESCGVCASNVAPFEGRPWYSYPQKCLGENVLPMNKHEQE